MSAISTASVTDFEVVLRPEHSLRKIVLDLQQKQRDLTTMHARNSLRNQRTMETTALIELLSKGKVSEKSLASALLAHYMCPVDPYMVKSVLVQIAEGDYLGRIPARPNLPK